MKTMRLSYIQKHHPWTDTVLLLKSNSWVLCIRLLDG